MSLTASIKSIQDIMRKDVGVDGDAQRISQMVWLLFLKIFDAQETELEMTRDDYRSPFPKSYDGVTGPPTPKASPATRSSPSSTASFSPLSISGSGTSSMSIITSRSTPRGTYQLTVTGTSGSLAHSAGVSLRVR